MKNRLICLALCVVMILSLALTGCGKKSDDDVKDDITQAASENALTLTMWVVSKEPVSAEVAKAVNDELNTISKARFKTELIVKFFTEDEYQSKLTETIVANQTTTPDPEETKAPSKDDEDAVVTDETRVNEYGWVEIVYPPEKANQVDIIYIAGEDMFNEFVANEWLAELDDELSTGSKKIKEYVSSTLLSAAKQDGTTYAIPNNNVIGEYTYMLLDKTLVDKYCQQGYIERGLIDGFANDYLYDFLDQIQEFESSKGVLPVDATYEDCLKMLAHYWNIDPTTYDMLEGFSIFGYHYTDLEELSRGSVVMGYQSLFSNEEFAKDFLALNRFRLGGYFGDAEASNKQAAVKFVKGDTNTIKQYKDDYYTVVVEYPTASVADVYSNMFGVYARSESVSRSMEVITYLNTNAEFRNILQYGKAGVHYELIKQDDGSFIVERDKYNHYIMDIYATGNAFIAYPEPDMSQDIWENGKLQNRVSLVEPLLGFDFASFAETTGEYSSSVSVDAKTGYNVFYTAGYSKDVLSQNEELKAWLEQSDAAGKNIYVHKSTQSSGQYLISEFYIYANQLTGAMEFSIGEEAVMQTTTTTDKKGNPVTTTKQVGVKLSFDLTETNTPDADGYQIIKVTLQNRRSNYSASVLYNLNGAPKTDFGITERNGLLDFSFFDTNEYSIEVYEQLSKAAIRYNTALLDWVNSCTETQKKAQTYMLKHEKTENGKTVYTFVVLRNGLTNVTELNVVPTGNTGSLDLGLHFSDDGAVLDLEIEEEGDTREPSYILYYIRVTANENVNVTYSSTYQGYDEDFVFSGVLEQTVTENVTTKDPNFVQWGSLDTELVKFLYNLNNEVNAMINSCATYDELEMLVADLRIMLATGEAVPVYEDIQTDMVKEFIEGQRSASQTQQAYLSFLHERLNDAVSMSQQTPPKDESSGEDKLYEGMEEYVCYYSPSAIYYAWLESYGFLPPKK